MATRRARTDLRSLLGGLVVGVVVLSGIGLAARGDSPSSVDAGAAARGLDGALDAPASFDADAGAADGTPLGDTTPSGFGSAGPAAPGTSTAGASASGSAGSSGGSSGSGASGASGGAPTTAAPSDAPAPPTPTGADAPANSATDVGVTADAIAVTALIADLGGLGEAGFAVSLGDEEAIYEAYVREINEAGGINGRQVDLAFVAFDPLSQTDMRRACIAATEDRESFVVVNLVGFYGAAMLCITEEHQTPYLAYVNETEQWYQRSGGRYFSFGMSKDRMMQNLAHELVGLGLLEDAVIGTLESASATDGAAAQLLVDTLASLGHPVTERAILSEDAAEAQAQIPIAVQNMQTAGVTHVILVQNLLGSQTFVQQAERRLFFPQYFHSDLAQGTTNGATAQMPESYDGAVGITASTGGSSLIGAPQPAHEADCEARLEANGGPDITYGADDDNYTAVLLCTIIDTFRLGAEAQGANLTRDGFAAAVANRGPFAASGILSASFRPGKGSAADAVRTLQWAFERDGERCRCWVPVDQPRPARF